MNSNVMCFVVRWIFKLKGQILQFHFMPEKFFIVVILWYKSINSLLIQRWIAARSPPICLSSLHYVYGRSQASLRKRLISTISIYVISVFWSRPKAHDERGGWTSTLKALPSILVPSSPQCWINPRASPMQDKQTFKFRPKSFQFSFPAS